MEEYQFGDWVAGTREIATMELIFDEDHNGTSEEDRIFTDQDKDQEAELMDSAPSVYEDQDPMGSIVNFLNFSLSRDVVDARRVDVVDQDERVDVAHQDEQDQGQDVGNMLGVSGAVILLVSLVGMSVFTWYRRMHASVDFQKVMNNR